MELNSRTTACFTCRWNGDCIIGASAESAATGQPFVSRVEVIGTGNGLVQPTRQAQLTAILRSGLLRLDRIDTNGDRHMLGLILPGEPVGELLPTRLPNTVTALVDSRICRFRKDSDTRFSDLPPDLRRALLRSFSVRLARLQTLLWIRTTLTVDARVAALLLMAARFMPLRPGPEGAMLLKFILPRADAADLIATTVESFCRALQNLKDSGLIVIHDARHFELCDPKGLKAMSSLDDSNLVSLFPNRRGDVRPRTPASDKSHRPSTLHRFAQRRPQDHPTTTHRTH